MKSLPFGIDEPAIAKHHLRQIEACRRQIAALDRTQPYYSYLLENYKERISLYSSRIDKLRPRGDLRSYT